MKKDDLNLPQASYDFLNLMMATLKPKSVIHYESCIRCLFRFLKMENIEFKDLNRSHIERWLIWMTGLGHHVTTRFRRIQDVRFFLRWCAEHGFLNPEQANLIESYDFPKLPQRLPRPFPYPIDQIITERLRNSDSILHKGLLLARLTGMRIGEVISLPRECVFEDPSGKKSVKVPLGKLNTERLVPINDEAHELIENIKEKTLHNTTAFEKRKRPLCPECGGHKHMDQARYSSDYIPKRLIVLDNGRYPSYSGLRSAWNRILHDLRKEEKDRMTIHRLRHTYATSMMSGGMSIVSLMKILGHKDIRMTLIYGDVSQEKIHYEYKKALEHINERYSVQMLEIRSEMIMVKPHVILGDITKWLDTNQYHITKEPRRFLSILKRLKIIEKDLKAFGIEEKMPVTPQAE